MGLSREERASQPAIFALRDFPRAKVITIRALRPTLREKSRYIAYRANAEGAVNAHDVEKAVQNQLLLFLGVREYALAGVQVLSAKMNNQKVEGVIKVERDYVDGVRAGLMLVRQVGGHRARMQSISVSGILSNVSEEKKGGVS